MICVTIGRGRHKMLIAEHQHLAENGARLVELRLDFIRRAVDLNRILGDRPGPVVATCRRPQDGGKWRDSEAHRITVLRSAIAAGVEYVDLEEDIAGNIPRYGNTKRIISYHNLTETPANIGEIKERMKQLDPDIIKIATLANNTGDMTRVLNLCKDPQVPTIAFCMGEIGLPSRILCRKFGAPFTYASFNKDRIFAPGQLTYLEMNDKYNFDRINRETKVYGVIADPVAHSLSPLIHNANMRKEKFNGVYLPFRVNPDDLQTFMQDCPELEIEGLSVTIPHKETILKSLNGLDEDVAGIRACNTVVLKEGDNYGYNTDCSAAMMCIRNEVEDNGTNKPFTGLNALVLGSGGVAKAMTYGLLRHGAAVLISGRNTRKAEQLAGHFGCHSVDWAARHGINYNILINCTPAGMFPDMDETPFERDGFIEDSIVMDTIYNPEQTLFVKLAKETGCRVITGVDMFVYQAAMQFRLFTGMRADRNLMYSEVKRAISAANY